MVYNSNLAPRRRYNANRFNSNDDAVPRCHPSNDRDLIIRHDVYISRGARLRRGVKIGNGAIIVAFSVVTKDVPPYPVVAGNPARVVRMRYGADQISRLQDLAWWEYDFRTISTKTHITNIDLFTDRMRQLIGSGTIEAFRPRSHYIRELLGEPDAA